MTCTVLNPVNGKKSVLFDQLVTALGNQEEATDIYNKIIDRKNPSENSFVNQFGDWQQVAKDLREINILDIEKSEEILKKSNFANRLNDDFEPLLKTKNNQQYFEMANGDLMFLRKVRFPKLSTDQAIEITNQLTYIFSFL